MLCLWYHYHLSPLDMFLLTGGVPALGLCAQRQTLSNLVSYPVICSLAGYIHGLVLLRCRSCSQQQPDGSDSPCAGHC